MWVRQGPGGLGGEKPEVWTVQQQMFWGGAGWFSGWVMKGSRKEAVKWWR